MGSHTILGLIICLGISVCVVPTADATCAPNYNRREIAGTIQDVEFQTGVAVNTKIPYAFTYWLQSALYNDCGLFARTTLQGLRIVDTYTCNGDPATCPSVGANQWIKLYTSTRSRGGLRSGDQRRSLATA